MLFNEMPAVLGLSAVNNTNTVKGQTGNPIRQGSAPMNSKVPVGANTQPVYDGSAKNEGSMLGTGIGLFIFAYFLPVIVLILILGVISFLVSLTLRMGMIHLQIDAARGNKLDYKTLLSDVNLSKAFKVYLVNLLYTMVVILGFMFFILPGFYFMYKYRFALWFFVDKNMSVTESFGASSRATKGVKFKLLWLDILFALATVIGFLVFFVGFLYVAIVGALVNAYIYNKLSSESSEIPAVEPALAK